MNTEELFDIYEESRSLKDLQPLYNLGIYLYKIDGATTARKSSLNTEEKMLVKAYDKINGKFEFTKILVY